MRCVRLASEIDLEGWRTHARALLAERSPPSNTCFLTGVVPGGLFDDEEPPPPAPADFAMTVPRAFMDLAASVALHRSVDRYDLLYRLLWRLQRERTLLHIVSDRDVADAMERAKNVSRASHKMKAFVRFRRIEDEGGERWIAWFEPAHRVLERTAPFFQRRFTTMHWTILTPDGTADWDGERLTFGPPATKDQAPDGDDVEEFWKTYYASTFNPARLKTRMMQSEMPRRYWANLPEAALIPELVARAAVRVTAESPRSLMRPPTRAPTTPTEPKFNGTDRKAVPRERLK